MNPILDFDFNFIDRALNLGDGDVCYSRCTCFSSEILSTERLLVYVADDLLVR